MLLDPAGTFLKHAVLKNRPSINFSSSKHHVTPARHNKILHFGWSVTAQFSNYCNTRTEQLFSDMQFLAENRQILCKCTRSWSNMRMFWSVNKTDHSLRRKWKRSLLIRFPAQTSVLGQLLQQTWLVWHVHFGLVRCVVWLINHDEQIGA